MKTMAIQVQGSGFRVQGSWLALQRNVRESSIFEKIFRPRIDPLLLPLGKGESKWGSFLFGCGFAALSLRIPVPRMVRFARDFRLSAFAARHSAASARRRLLFPSFFAHAANR